MASALRTGGGETVPSVAAMTPRDDDDLLDVAIEAAREAGAVLVRHAAGAVRGLATKSSPTDPVSQADLEAEATIRDVLARRRPDDAIVGEEGDDTPGTTGLHWVVDPLDGTVNFLYGLPQWCVSVACEGHVGVVFDPVRDELFAVGDSGAATLDGETLRGSACDDIGHALVATGFGYEAAVRIGQAQVVSRVLPHVRDIRRAGSAALDLAWTAAGRHDAYFELGVQRWDVAAGRLLCAAAGLRVVDLPARDGLPAGLLVAAPAVADALLALVAP
jgi:myo-inositol-1(or 4)-monophosphatase